LDDDDLAAGGDGDGFDWGGGGAIWGGCEVSDGGLLWGGWRLVERWEEGDFWIKEGAVLSGVGCPLGKCMFECEIRALETL
jgi:hypothetical protein